MLIHRLVGFLERAVVKGWFSRIVAFVLVCGGVVVASEPELQHSGPPGARVAVDLDAAIAKASQSRRPLLVLVIDSTTSRADDLARALVDTARNFEATGPTPIILDVAVSRNRATAMRFHLQEAPMLVCLTPMGVISSRDQPPITRALITNRAREVMRRAPEIDTTLGLLQQAAGKHPADAKAQFALGEFLRDRQNAREAITHYAIIAHSDSDDPALRVRAWVELARMHYWIGEPEKGRHEAQDLIASLGTSTPEARAGGMLVLGLQDANAKRIGRARQELKEAITAAPDSSFAKDAKKALETLPARESDK